MNKPIFAAAIIMTATIFLHVIGGGEEVHVPMQAGGLSPFLAAFAAVLWHAVTVVLIIMALALFWLARHPNRPLALALIGLMLGWSAVFILYGAVRLGDLWQMPQWTIFTTVPALMIWGLMMRKTGVDQT
ncbi:MAG: hypothetical protein ACRBBK_12470 [Paracoccaceae bacterium]